MTSTPHSTTIPIIDLTLSPEHSIISKSNVRTDPRLRLNLSYFNHSQLEHPVYLPPLNGFEVSASKCPKNVFSKKSILELLSDYKTFEQQVNQHYTDTNSTTAMSLLPTTRLIYSATNQRARENLLIEEIDNLIRQLMNGPYHYSPYRVILYWTINDRSHFYYTATVIIHEVLLNNH
ncbi:unnamed protein product [Adineta steineri]|uniref:Uncharacterized protein n=1 Tax=Adineta steineri TaxID=433720 RepID=A0A815V884_9BILA|nr:unnamed protein product [Adineta steineri]CAF1652145.1 unnamed protein product [Adineta steineri]